MSHFVEPLARIRRVCVRTLKIALIPKKRGKFMAAARRTQDHEEIRAWVEKHGGAPAVVQSIDDGSEDAIGVLRIKFEPDESNMRDVDWDEFFDTFDNNDLAFIYQMEGVGKDSRFFKIVRA
jgi:hypothetical protein